MKLLIKILKAVYRRIRACYLKCIEKIDRCLICPVIYYFIEKKQKNVPIDRDLPTLYFCHTPYHLLITLVKVLQSHEKSVLMLYKGMPNVSNLCDEIQKLEIFNGVYVSTFLDEELEKYYQYKQKKYFSRWNAKRLLMEQEHNLDIVQAYHVKMYNDFCVLGYYLNVIRQPYDVIEDGLNAYCVDGYFHKRCLKSYKEIAYNYLRKTICTGYAGSALARELEVNDAEVVYMPYDITLREVPRRELFSNLDKMQKKLLTRIFDIEPVVEQLLEKDGKKNLVLTQPLVTDYVVPTEEIQLNLYEELVQELDGEVYIKLHPRDHVDYSRLEQENCHVLLKSNFPVELLNFVNVEFEECITLCSTSIGGLENIKNARSLFHEYGEISRYVREKMESAANEELGNI